LSQFLLNLQTNESQDDSSNKANLSRDYRLLITLLLKAISVLLFACHGAVHNWLFVQTRHRQRNSDRSTFNSTLKHWNHYLQQSLNTSKKPFIPAVSIKCAFRSEWWYSISSLLHYESIDHVLISLVL